MLLIITNKDDPHSDRVIEWIDQNFPDKQIFRYNTDHANDEFHFSVDEVDLILRSKNRSRSFSFNEGDVVWYRRPKTVTFEKIADYGLRKFTERQFDTSIKGLLLASEEKCIWVNPISSSQAARNKLMQLRTASSVGLNVPPYIVTNDPEKLENFASSFSKVCIKSVSDSVYRADTTTYIPLWTKTLKNRRQVELVLESTSEWGPAFFQKFIDKIFEARVVVFGNNAHAFQQRLKNPTAEDIRVENPDLIECSLISIPRHVERSIVGLMKGLKIKFASMDFLIDSDGEWWFVEANPNGQWLWLEDATGFPLMRSFYNTFLLR